MKEQFVIDDFASLFEVYWVDTVVVAAGFGAGVVLDLTAMTAVMEEEDVVRPSTHGQPLHRFDHVLARGHPAGVVVLVIGEHDRVGVGVAVPREQELFDVADIVLATAELIVASGVYNPRSDPATLKREGSAPQLMPMKSALRRPVI